MQSLASHLAAASSGYRRPLRHTLQLALIQCAILRMSTRKSRLFRHSLGWNKA